MNSLILNIVSPVCDHLSIVDVRVQKAAVGYLCSTLFSKFEFWSVPERRRTVSCIAGLCPTISTDDILSVILDMNLSLIHI